MLLERIDAIKSLPSDAYLIVCYCAEWCRTCESFKSAFSTLASEYEERYAFVYIDVEEHYEMLGDEDIDNFPTILIQKEGVNHYFGEILPYASHLKQLIDKVDVLKSDVNLPHLVSLLSL
ncbi:MAG: thioredoxin family protein [Alcaligenaceae bacterium]|nr:thioredoxin family protein [Alcaligenaceae bacterium]